MKQFWLKKAVCAGISLIALAWYISTTAGQLGRTTFDDAYMYSRYAKHFLSGAGFSWNPADGPSYGITSPAHLFLVTAVLGFTNLSDAAALTGISFAAALLSVGAVALLGFLVQDVKPLQASWAPLLAVPCLVIMPAFRYHSTTGMETTLALFANSLFACAIIVAARRRSSAALAFCLVSGYMSYATRPDSGLYALLLPPAFFVATERSLWRYSVRYTALFAVVAIFDLAIKRVLFGDFLPLPFYAKVSGFYQGYLGAFKWNAMTEMLLFWSVALPCLIVLAAATSKKSIPRLLSIAVPVFLTFGYFATVTQIMGYQARYYYPSLPFFFLAAFIVATSSREEAAGPRFTPARIGLRLLIGAALLLPVMSTSFRSTLSSWWQKHVIGAPVAVRSATPYLRFKQARLPRLGWWTSIKRMCELLERMPRGVTLAASEYGFIGSRFPDVTIIDLVGLHDREIAHDGFTAARVLSREPDIIWFPHPDYTHAVAQLLDNLAFQRNYEFFPDTYDYGIALRKKSTRYAAVRTAVESEFSRIYGNSNLSYYLARPFVLPDGN